MALFLCIMSPDERALLQRVGVVMLRDFAILTVMVLNFGAFIILFSFSAFALLQRGLASRATQAMLGTTLIAFLVSSVMTISYFIAYVISAKGALVESAGILDKLMFARVNERLFLYSDIIAVTSMLIPILSDGVVIWRAWVLYPDKQWIMLVPCALLVGTIGATVANLVLLFKGSQNPLLVPVSDIVFTASLALSLGTNVAATGLIIYKLWGHLRFVRQMGIKQDSTSSVQKILIVLVESGYNHHVWPPPPMSDKSGPDNSSSARFCSYTSDSVYRDGQRILLEILMVATAMYPSIVIVLVSLQCSTVETFGFSTPVGFRSVQAIEFSSARPASPEHLSVAGNPLDGKTHVSFAAACVLKEANADRGPVGKVSATSTGIGQITD
ncbi:hypothetical protein D9615_008468 [Tricholomella constricta]|uniref:Uncharacterized protein n=1 Tax=Tricholomella constricta TaxID=117010 RepID=A0A8H5M0N1_9AGAR|nr:hypothetical protein D9615_008468 [Tricholomella constricta]